MQRLPSVAVLLTILFASVCGCFRDGTSGVMTVPVTGIVRYQGKPLPRGSISFQPVQPAQGFPMRPASGTIDETGRYAMSTFAKGDGVIPGEYQVRIMSYETDPSPEMPASKAVWIIPKRYGNPNESGLSITISETSGSSNVVKDFELKD